MISLTEAIEPDAPLSEAASLIADGGIALVVDRDMRLLGTITDGDVRRALLAGGDMEAPARRAMNAGPISVPTGTPRQACYARMQQESIFHLPVVDAEGRVQDVVRLAELATGEPLKNRVVLMAGGLGSRLRPLTDDKPKPMLPVGGRPLLQTIVEGFIAHGFGRFTISLNYLGEQIEHHFGDGKALGVEIAYTREDKPLGTAGCLDLLPERPEEPFFVMNGDILTRIDYRGMLDFHAATGASATVALNTYSHKVPFGLVDIEGDSVTGIREKPVFSFFVAAGIYVLSPDALDLIPDDRYFDMPSLFEALIAQGRQVSAYPIHEYWMDIGQPHDLAQAEAEYLSVFEPVARRA